MPGYAGSTRRSRLPADWPALREATRSRAGGRCEWARICRALPELAAWARVRGHLTVCRQAGTDCDHIERGDDHRPANLGWICRRHHLMKSGWEGGRSLRGGRRTPERHPGIIPTTERAGHGRRHR